MNLDIVNQNNFEQDIENVNLDELLENYSSFHNEKIATKARYRERIKACIINANKLLKIYNEIDVKVTDSYSVNVLNNLRGSFSEEESNAILSDIQKQFSNVLNFNTRNLMIYHVSILFKFLNQNAKITAHAIKNAESLILSFKLDVENYLDQAKMKTIQIGDDNLLLPLNYLDKPYITLEEVTIPRKNANLSRFNTQVSAFLPNKECIGTWDSAKTAVEELKYVGVSFIAYSAKDKKTSTQVHIYQDGIHGGIYDSIENAIHCCTGEDFIKYNKGKTIELFVVSGGVKYSSGIYNTKTKKCVNYYERNIFVYTKEVINRVFPFTNNIIDQIIESRSIIFHIYKIGTSEFFLNNNEVFLTWEYSDA